MISSPTASSSSDRNSDLESNNVPSKFQKPSKDNRLETSVDMTTPRFPPSQLAQAAPFVYVHTPSNALYVSPNSPSTFVKSTPSIPILKPSTVSHKPMPSLSVPSTQSVLLPNKNNAMKPQQIVIQKGGTFLIKPVNLGGYSDNVLGNKIHITTTSSYVPKPIAPKFVLTSLPKPTGMTVKNPVQSNLTILPMTVPTTTESSQNAFKIVNTPLLSFQIADKQSTSPINVVCDSNSNSSDDSDNKLICSEIIDLDSPVKEEQSPNNDIIISSPNLLEKPVKKPKELKFSQHGVSILKKSITFCRDNFNHNSKSPTISDSVSATPVSKDIEASISNLVVENTVPASSEPKGTSIVTQKSGRRKSSFCYRKDFDDSIQFLDDAVDLQKSLQDNGISLTRAENNDVSSNEKNEENEVELKIIETLPDLEIETAFDEDINKMIKWENGLGKLPGTDLKFIMNEFNMVEFISNSDYEDTVAAKTTKSKEKIKEEDIRCIQCGCYGLLSDFISTKYCSFSCKEKRKEIMKEKELKHKKRKKMKKREMEENKNDGESESSVENSYNSRIPMFWKCKNKEFSWAKYLEFTKSQSAPVKLFSDPFPYSRNKFKPGMKLEGIDPHHPSHFCILTVVEVQGYRMRLHFDGFPKDYDFWVNADSNDIFPLGWCEKNGRYLNPPPEYADEEFNWVQYVKDTRSLAAPKSSFPDRSRNVSIPINITM